ncbi:hypothetical protein RHSIM_Rhsim12G0175800 [Rhododendron simsii]|uniref:Proteasome subunit alpha type n=1 Tax=Rhododendron simsii TaxID=118357 RepID=A0A834G326_RHOSS|nr:hypothetical protein RHSIM_Rhsim12G0175800 [Rhododendron simsii]
MGDSQYSFSLTTFSPSGKLVQIEHALTAVGSGQTSLGIKVFADGSSVTWKSSLILGEVIKFDILMKMPPYLEEERQIVEVRILVSLIGSVGCTNFSLHVKAYLAANGVVIATEKKLPSILVDEASIFPQHLASLSLDCLITCSGMGPDARVLVRKSRKQAEQYHRLYKEPIPVTQLVRETAAVMQEFTQSGGVRPFGVSLLVAGFDDKGPQLYQVDPSGSYFSWKASAMGKNVSNAKTFLEKRYTDDMELDDAVHTAILTLKEGVLTPSEIADYLEEVE